MVFGARLGALGWQKCPAASTTPPTRLRSRRRSPEADPRGSERCSDEPRGQSQAAAARQPLRRQRSRRRQLSLPLENLQAGVPVPPALASGCRSPRGLRLQKRLLLLRLRCKWCRPTTASCLRSCSTPLRTGSGRWPTGRSGRPAGARWTAVPQGLSMEVLAQMQHLVGAQTPRDGSDWGCSRLTRWRTSCLPLAARPSALRPRLRRSRPWRSPGDRALPTTCARPFRCRPLETAAEAGECLPHPAATLWPRL